VTRFAVDYPADVAQLSAGSGATNMSQHIISMAAQCSNTKFVIGGYSQGATVTDIAIGIKTVLGSGTSIPTELAPRVAAVVVFGNPQRIVGSDIPSSSALYGPKAIDFCAAGDPVCQGGVNGLAHIAYLTNGDIDKGAKFAAGKVLSTSGGTAPTSSASQSSSGGLLGLLGRLGNR
jgi:cutinase